MAETPTSVPSEFVAGDTVEWLQAEDTDYPIATWTLTYAFLNKNHQFEVTCTDNGDGNYLASITPADSNAIPAGKYRYQAYISDGTNRHSWDQGRIEVLPNYATLDGGYDDRTHWRTVLENVEAVIKGRATKDQSSYTINGRQLSRTPMADLLKLYDKAKYMVAQEERAESIAKGLGQSGTIKLRM